MKLVTVVGARPQFVKAGAVRRAIDKFNRTRAARERIRETWVHTGQHYDYLLDRVFFEELDLPEPNHHLGVGSGPHGRQTAAILERIEVILEKERPEGVIVYGDTNSTLAGALAAAKLHLPLIHIEAGLRSYNRLMAEEVNRLLTDHVSTVLFCPTRQAVQNLATEGIRNGKGRVVTNVGDVMYDSILYYSNLADKKSTILKDLGLLAPRASRPTDYFLATLHRAENTDRPERLKSILKALNTVAEKNEVVFPIHPRTRKKIEASRLRPMIGRIRCIEPVSYLNMLHLEKNASAVFTDSGGVQKEAYWFGVPCFTLREETEWTETVRSGWNVLAGVETKGIVDAVRAWNGAKVPRRTPGLFGDGRAAEKIVRTIAEKSRWLE
jgi:UDP-N-acetylglucosamine 2-epimerase